MKRISLLLWSSGAAAFYMFKTPLGLAFILVASAVGMGLCLFVVHTAFHKVLCCMLVIGSVLGGFCAFRFEVASFTTTFRKPPRSFILLEHEADVKATALYTHLIALNNNPKEIRGARLSTNAAALFVALTTGRKSYVPRAFQDIARRSGISHLLALSGFHLQVLLFFITRFQRVIPRTMFSLSAFILVWFYCLWVGFIPSLWRAAFMYTIGALGLICMGLSCFTITWSLTGVLMMLMFPQVLSMPGFVLSMLALYGIMQGGTFYSRVFQSYTEKLMPRVIPKPLRSHMRTWGARFCSACAVGVGAVGTTMWYSMIVFGVSYPIGIATSLLLTPVVVFFMIIGISLLGVQTLLTAFVFFALPFRLLEVCTRVLSYIMNALSYGMNALLARLAQAHSISTWMEMMFFYAILVAICIPYYFNTPRGKSFLRFCTWFPHKLCIARRT